MGEKIKQMIGGDKTIWCIFIALCAISLIEVYSATSTLAYRKEFFLEPIIRHGFFLCMGITFAAVVQAIPVRFFSSLILLLPITWILLGLTWLFGEDVNGAQRFLGVGAFTIQPSEIAKLSMIGFMAFLLSRQKPENEKVLFKVMIVGIVPTCFCIALENLSTAVLLFIVCYLIMFIGQVNGKKLGAIFLGCAAFGLVSVGTLKFIPEDSLKGTIFERAITWKARIDRFAQPDELLVEIKAGEDVKIPDEKYQEYHANIAVANGYIPSLPGSGTERDFLPQAYSDFIYAIILEETGLLGGIVTVLLYVALMIRAGVLASKNERLFPRFLILGCAMMIVVQALFNMCVAVGIAPVTGQPLPLISRGGTSTIITCLYFGVILACTRSKDPEHEDADESIANIDFE